MLAWAMLGVMTVTLAAVLQGSPVLWPALAAVAAAYGGSALLVHGRLRGTPAFVETDGPTARLWSVWDASAPPRRPVAVAVWEARLVRGELVLSLGDAVETLLPADWAEFDMLVEAMREAARQKALIENA